MTVALAPTFINRCHDHSIGGSTWHQHLLINGGCDHCIGANIKLHHGDLWRCFFARITKSAIGCSWLLFIGTLNNTQFENSMCLQIFIHAFRNFPWRGGGADDPEFSIYLTWSTATICTPEISYIIRRIQQKLLNLSGWSWLEFSIPASLCFVYLCLHIT